MGFLEPLRRSHGCTLEFASVRNFDLNLPYTISIKLMFDGSGEGEIEMTAVYGGDFKEHRIFAAPIRTFRFRERNFGKTTVPLVIDEALYTGDGDYSDMLEYLMPRPGSIWRSAMNVSEETEERVVTAIADTCKAGDDFVCVTGNQDSQCENLLKRLPQAAKENIKSKRLVGKQGWLFSKRSNDLPGPKV